MNFNKAIIIGRVTRDPEVRTTPSGQTVASIGVASNRVWNSNTGERQEKTEFHSIVAWGKLAEICGQYLVKGQLVLFEGRLETRAWEGQDGIKRSKTEIIAENMQMGPKARAQQEEGARTYQAGGGAQKNNPQNNNPQNNEGETQNESANEQENEQDDNSEEELEDKEEIRIEDIPF